MPEEQSRILALEREVATLKREVERLQNENRRWARLAGTDSLTGLPNKVSFLRAFLPQVFQRAAQEQQPVGMVLLAADNLGDVNQDLGREAGDEVLKNLSKLVQALVGDEGRLGHLDGTNFAILMYPATIEAARARANMVRARVRAHAFPFGDKTIQLTVSAGITAVLSREGADFQALGEDSFRRLNRALYLAKKAGGNRVEVATDTTAAGKDPGT